MSAAAVRLGRNAWLRGAAVIRASANLVGIAPRFFHSLPYTYFTYITYRVLCTREYTNVHDSTEYYP